MNDDFETHDEAAPKNKGGRPRKHPVEAEGTEAPRRPRKFSEDEIDEMSDEDLKALKADQHPETKHWRG
jgi:hypothetical protein